MNTFAPLVLYTLISAALFYLGSEAVITQFLWLRYPGQPTFRCTGPSNDDSKHATCYRLILQGTDCSRCGTVWTGDYIPSPRSFAVFMACPACVGFWWGVLLGILGYWQKIPFLGLSGNRWMTVVAAGLCIMVTTPLVAHLHRRALEG